MTKEIIGAAIIGCGKIGRKRAKYLGDARLVACADISVERAQDLARNASNVYITNDWQTILSLPNIDVVIICTPHNLLAQITKCAIEAGKNVLVEKPAAKSIKELEELVNQAGKTNVKVHVGYNHRYHPAILKARELYLKGELGKLMYIRGRYGHGGRLGYESEWRANPMQSGGGELIDQGVHLIDLARWFLGEFDQATGFIRNYFWNTTVEDNAFMFLSTSQKQVAFLHSSCTEWKNLFSFEIYGQKGKLDVAGLGGSYGLERLVFYRMLPQMGPPESMIWEYPQEDKSWAIEFTEFIEDIKQDRRPSVTLQDALAVLRIVDAIYRENM